MRSAHVLSAVTLAGWLAACGEESYPAPTPSAQGGAGGATSDPQDDPFTLPGRCSSQIWRDPNESEGPEMMPGHACTSCHVQENAASGEGDAPIFAFAGTLYPSGHEPDDCVGASAEGAEVIVTGADGKSFSALANGVGNFALEADGLILPVTAKVVFQGRERRMETPQPAGDCNLCHTAAGANLAPGRIVLP